MKEGATKRKGSIDPRALINTRNFVIVMGFTGFFRDEELPNLTSRLYGTNIQLDNVFVSIVSFTLPAGLLFVLVFLMFN